MELVKWNEAKRAIAEARSVDEVSQIRNRAEAVRYALIQAKEAPEVIRQAEEIKLRAERRAGEILKKDENISRGSGMKKKSKPTTTLKEMSVSRDQSSKWQRIAEIPEEAFEEYIEEAKDITTAGAVKLSKKLSRPKARKAAPLPVEGRYTVIYADPPWNYDFSNTENREIENQYPTMEIEDIRNMSIPAADNSVLLLWATAPKLEEALSVMDSWGFVYRTCAVWDKEVIGMGYWFRGQHELLLVGVRGSFSPPGPESRVGSVYREKRGKHSKKPEHYYGLIESMFPGERYLELFARGSREGWDSWGNEV